MPEFRPTASGVLTMLLLLMTPVSALAAGELPPSFVPQMDLSYIDPQSGELVSCGEGCRRFEVPDGVELEIRVKVQNKSAVEWKEGVPWDLWFDQRRFPFPGIDLSDCHDASEDRLDIECWLALNDRVEWDASFRRIQRLRCSRWFLMSTVSALHSPRPMPTWCAGLSPTSTGSSAPD